MKNTPAYALTAIIAIITLMSFNNSNELIVHVTNINKLEGDIEIGIFQDSKAFPHEGSQMYKLRKAVSRDTLAIVFNGLPDGEYAIVLFHDINNDGICNVNFIGYPKEPYGFSNNRRPFLKSPSFKSTKFSLTMNKEIYIKLIG